MCHSYGGIVMTEAVGRLVADRKSENKRGSGEAGRIRWLVYVAAYPTMEDMPLFGFAISVLGTLGIEPPTSIPYWDMQVSQLPLRRSKCHCRLIYIVRTVTAC